MKMGVICHWCGATPVKSSTKYNVYKEEHKGKVVHLLCKLRADILLNISSIISELSLCNISLNNK